jgi:hypothetical protein
VNKTSLKISLVLVIIICALGALLLARNTGPKVINVWYADASNVRPRQVEILVDGCKWLIVPVQGGYHHILCDKPDGSIQHGFVMSVPPEVTPATVEQGGKDSQIVLPILSAIPFPADVVYKPLENGTLQFGLGQTVYFSNKGGNYRLVEYSDGWYAVVDGHGTYWFVDHKKVKEDGSVVTINLPPNWQDEFTHLNDMIR